MLLLVYVHAYNLGQRYLEPFTTVEEPLTFTTFFQYCTANGLFRFRIPMLFAISGYLFALTDARPFGERIKKRLRTLLVPYLLWSAFGIGLTWCLEQGSVTSEAVRAAHLGPFGGHPIVQYSWNEFLITWLVSPIPFQLWFIRCLLMYNALYPLLLKAVLKIPKIWFPIATFLWLSMFAVPLLEGEGLLFFSLGIYVQKRSFNLEQPPTLFRRRLDLPSVAGAWIALCSVKTLLAFYGTQWMGDGVFIVLLLLHKLAVVLGLFVCWYGLDGVVQWCMARRWFVWCSSFSFMLYAFHVPLVNYALQPAFVLMSGVPYYRLLLYVALPLLLIACSIALGAALRRFARPVYAVLTGGRGM